MRKFSRFMLVFFLLLFLAYLVLPPGEVPALPDSLKSDEPGDTVEMPGVSAYYTDLAREEVVEFYRAYFCRSSFLNLPLPVVVLNYPPEYGKTAIRETTESTFLYELVHPMRDSLFINGWDPAETLKYKAAKDPKKVIEKGGRYWQRKITLRAVETSFLVRLLVSIAAIFCLGLVLGEGKKIVLTFFDRWRLRK